MNRYGKDIHDEIAEGERWLAGFPTPPVSASARAQIKQAIRGELGKNRGTSAGRWAPWHGGLAAAAALALSVVIGWQSMNHLGSDNGSMPRQEETAFVLMVPDSPPASESISELEEIAEDDVWAVNGEELYEALQSALDDDWESKDDARSSGQSHVRSDFGEVS